MSYKIFYNESIKTGTFPDNLILSDLSQVFKKKGPLNSTNYHLVSILLTVSELFEKVRKNQITGMISICSEAFVTIHHVNFIGNLNAYDFQHEAMKLIYSSQKNDGANQESAELLLRGIINTGVPLVFVLGLICLMPLSMILLFV